MADSGMAAMQAAIERLQGIELDDTQWAQTIGAAERLSAVARAAATELAFGAEPSSFAVIFESLARGDGRHD